MKSDYSVSADKFTQTLEHLLQYKYVVFKKCGLGNELSQVQSMVAQMKGTNTKIDILV